MHQEKQKDRNPFEEKHKSMKLKFIFTLCCSIISIIFLVVTIKFDSRLRNKRVYEAAKNTPNSYPNLWYKKSVDEIFTKKSSSRPKFLSNTSNHCQLYKHPNNTSKNQNLLPKEQRMSIAFLKTHKCASSLIQKIFTNWMKKNGINRKPARFGPWMGGYPGKFNYDISRTSENVSLEETGSIINHMVWNLPELRKSFSLPVSDTQPQKRIEKDFFRIGLIRNPMSQYISTFNFYFGQRPIKKFNDTSSCMGEPWQQILGPKKVEQSKFDISMNPVSMNIGNFFDKTDLNSDQIPKAFKNAFWGFRAMNYMSADFGLDWKNPLSNQEIEKRVQEFDVIIILERLIESLILVKNLLCMDTKDILLENFQCGRCSHNQTIEDEIKKLATDEHLSKPVVHQSLSSDKLKEYNLTISQATMIEQKLNFNDIKLYNAVGKKFEEDMNVFGYDRMKKELLEFSQVTREHLKTDELVRTRRSAAKTKRNELSENLDSGLTKKFDGKLARYMIKHGEGFCGYFRNYFGLIEDVTDLDIVNGRQPWIDEIDFDLM